jgi:starch synthase
MLDAIRRAVALYHDEPEAWKRLMQRDMEADFSWDRSALEYQKVYEAITQ